MTNSKISTSSKSYNKELIIPKIEAREEKYIMITKRELDNLDSLYNFNNMIADIFMVLGSAGLGCSLSIIPTPTCPYVFMVIATLVCLVTGLYVRWGKKRTLNQVLNLYEE